MEMDKEFCKDCKGYRDTGRCFCDGGCKEYNERQTEVTYFNP